MIETKAKVQRPTEAERLFANLDKPSLVGLSYALRHPDTWPADFVWDFGDCEQCAMGLAHRLWDSVPQGANHDGTSIMARHFNMPFTDAEHIFFGDAYTRQRLFGLVTSEIPYKAVTPDMVADQIDKYLSRAE